MVIVFGVFIIFAVLAIRKAGNKHLEDENENDLDLD